MSRRVICAVAAALVLAAVAPAAAQTSSTGSPQWQDLVERVHARTEPIDARVRHGERPAFHASTLRVGRNIVLMEDTDNLIYEDGWFGRGGERSIEAILAAAYEVLDDDYDFITVVLNWNVQGVFAFYLPIANETLGLGLRNVPPNMDTFDMSEGKLQGFMMMNNWRFYRGENDALSRVVWLQEIGHRWGAFVNFDQGDGPRNDLLGRDLAHWSYFVHSENSAMEGNDWHHNNDGSFSTYTNARRMTYGQLDLYLMGVAGADTVPDFFFIDDVDTRGQRDSRGAPMSRASPPELGGDIRTVFGNRVDVTIDDIVAAEGVRSPGVRDAQKEFRMATVYLVRAGTNVSDTDFEAVETLVDNWETIFEEATRNEMNLIVALDGEEELEDVAFGEACEDSAQCDGVTATVCIGSEGDERICSRRCVAHDECGDGYCCNDPAETGDLFCYAQTEPCFEAAPEPEPAPDVGTDASDTSDVGADTPEPPPPPATATTDDGGCACDTAAPRSTGWGRGRSLLLWPFSTFR